MATTEKEAESSRSFEGSGKTGEAGELWEDADSLDEIDELEDVKKMVVTEALPADESGDETSTESDRSAITKGDLQEAEQVKRTLLSKKTGEKVDAREEELKEKERRDNMKVLLSGFIELKGKKEIEKAMLNEKKITAQFRNRFREERQKEFNLDLQKLKHAFQASLDLKKTHIHTLQRKRRMCVLNHLWADSAHYKNTEELFDYLRERAEKLKKHYLQELDETKNYYLQLEQQLLEGCKKAEEKSELLKELRIGLQEQIRRETKEALDRYKCDEEFSDSKQMEFIEGKSVTYVEKIAEELLKIAPPEHKIEEIREIFDDWKNKLAIFEESSAKTKKETKIVISEIPVLKDQVAAANNNLEHIKEDSHLYMRTQSQEIVRLQGASKDYEKKIMAVLKNIMLDSDEVMEKLRERQNKFDKIMRLKKLCDKFEADCDATSKIPSLDTVDSQKSTENECLTYIQDVCSKDIEDPTLLKNLCRKFSRVKLQNQMLQHDICKLKVENKALKSDMKKYLQGIQSGEWARMPEELRFDTDLPKIPKIPEQNEKTDSDTQAKRNLEKLRRKCEPITREILDTSL